MLAGGTAAADQKDPALDPLFDTLQRAATPAEAAAVEQRIWATWFDAGDAGPDVGRLMSAGAIATSAGDLARAEAIFDKIVGEAPEFAEGWNQRATVRYLRGRYEESIQDIGRTLALEPRHFGALSGLGLCNLALGRLQPALDAFERALAIDPQLPGARERIEGLRRQVEGEPV